jgi:hypothetical protein
MARMGHDSTRAAMIYQHVARGADKAITVATVALITLLFYCLGYPASQGRAG